MEVVVRGKAAESESPTLIMGRLFFHGSSRRSGLSRIGIDGEAGAVPVFLVNIRHLLLSCFWMGGGLGFGWSAPLLSPQEALKKMEVPPGFQVDLLAAEPDLLQPIAFAWDARGRIWVVEGHTYPTRATTPPARADGEGDLSQPNAAQKADIFAGSDRILIFEDADGNGSFETRKVFIEGLNLVSGLEIGYGGVYVGAAPYLLHIPLDVETDRPAGDPVILADGWGYQDTHETLNSFIWGPDGWLYGCHGVFTHSEVRVCTPKGRGAPRTPLNCAYWRFHPVKNSFEVFAHGTSNSWGFDFNEAGDWFAEACVIPHFWHIIQGGYYLRQSNPLGHFNPFVYTNIETIADHQHFVGTTPHSGNGVSDEAGGGHAHCGLLVYNGENFPAAYRGRAMMFNIHGQRINQENLVPSGSGYVAKHLPDFLKTHDPNFTGVALKVGPDGAVYFIDWYDQQKCHRTQPEIWDRSNGRLYRVKYTSTWNPWQGNVAALPDEAISKATKSTNGWLARAAQRTGRERMAAGQWGETSLFDQNDGEPDLNSLAAAAVASGSPRDRLKLASALQRIPVAGRWSFVEGLLQHAVDADDHNLPQMYWYAIEPCVPADPERALQLAATSKIPIVSQHIARRVADMGDDAALATLLTAMARAQTGGGLAVLARATLDGLKGRTGLVKPASWDGAYARFEEVIALDAGPAEQVGALRDMRTALAVAFGDQRVFPQLRQQVQDAALPLPRRQNALQTLISGRDAELSPLLLSLLTDEAMRLSALRGLTFQAMAPAGSEKTDGNDPTAAAVISLYPGFSPEEKAAAINALATRTAWASALLDAVARGTIARAEVPSFVARQIADFKDAALTASLEASWGKVGAAGDLASMAAAEMARWKGVLTPDFLKGADRRAGRVLYATSCGQCHTLFGQGGNIGPELTGSNRANLDYILENVIHPNALIGADYELNVFTLRDGRSVAGMIRKTTASALTVQTVTAEEVIAKSDIAEALRPGVSMMPMGLLTALTQEQVRDLVAYLASPSQVPLPGEGPVDDVMRVPGALEGETLKVIEASSGAVTIQKMSEFRESRWSGDEQLWWQGAKSGDRLTLALPVTQPGNYLIKAVFSRAPDYAVARFHLDGTPLSPQQIDFFGWKVTTTPLLTLGQRTLTPGEHQLTIEITGANPEAVKNFLVGLDYLWLERQ